MPPHKCPVSDKGMGSGCRWYSREEVKEHSVQGDCWLIALGIVFDLSPLLPLHPHHLAKPILLEAGGDISDWFDPQTADVKTHIDPISKLITYFTPQGRFIHIPPGYPSSDWDCSHELPWWKDPKYMIGKLSKKTRFVRIKNVLTALEAPLEVPSEENIREILERYLPRNGHAKSYTWKAVCETKDSFINLDMDKTLDENNIPDESQLFSSLHLPPDYHIPVILVYYDDDLTVA